jgi:cell wall-associated NlpC family hydrolase
MQRIQVNPLPQIRVNKRNVNKLKIAGSLFRRFAFTIFAASSPNDRCSMVQRLPGKLLLCFALTMITLLSACSSSRKVAGSGPSKAPLTERELRQKYATRVSAASGDIDNIALYRFIDEWYGVPYRYGGNGKNGVDCSGFSTKLYAAVYSTSIQRTAQLQYESCKRIRRKKLREGDLVFFHEGGKRITHVGVYLMNAYFVHASTGRGVMISNLEDTYWDEHFAGGGRIK